ncbi:hypothetical protein RRG08_064156 [Elysia crispata]|uniref:G-protein coupled receptors family 1 profile domain-containing protein n=1 Tax=Elysia crispata TaxID=231223 RepID=A0AAE0ZMC3_9GAST|nr:hypothetical protein RRG08_064156 [Elysia crispata]
MSDFLFADGELSVSDYRVRGNETQEILIGASPAYYSSWNIMLKISVMLLIVLVFVTNSVVIGLYHHVNRKVTMHEIHVCHLAVVDLLAGTTAIIPVIGGNVIHNWTSKHALSILCFIAAVSTLSCNVMATLICNIISYDRLRLLQLGIRYHLVHTRVFSIARLIFFWAVMIGITVMISILIIFTDIAKSTHPCAYSLRTDSWTIKIFMTLAAVGPLSVLVIINCLVRRKVRQLEERHPHVVNRPSSLAHSGNAERSDGVDQETSQVWWIPSTEPTSTGGAYTSAMPSEVSQQDSSPVRRKGATSVSKSLLRSFKSDRSLSKRATTSIFMSTMTFILCLSPISALLIIEAWYPNTIKTSTHRWHLWLTLIRAAIDPFMFARSVPSFR